MAEKIKANKKHPQGQMDKLPHKAFRFNESTRHAIKEFTQQNLELTIRNEELESSVEDLLGQQQKLKNEIIQNRKEIESLKQHKMQRGSPDTTGDLVPTQEMKDYLYLMLFTIWFTIEKMDQKISEFEPYYRYVRLTHGDNLKPVITPDSYIGVSDWIDLKTFIETISNYVHEIHSETNTSERQYNVLLDSMTDKINKLQTDTTRPP